MPAEYIDSRDLIEEADAIRDLIKEGENVTEEERELLEAIDTLADEVGGDWPYGAMLIREDCFVEYAQQLAEDIGAVDQEASWPAYCIDWERAAEDLKADYTTVEFGGATYYVRP